MSAKALEIYAHELRRWNRAVNLVSPKTLEELETRHIRDCAQLAKFMPDHPVTLMDWGSGAGLPGMILALFRIDDTVHLVESDLKKVEFLRHVSRETGRKVQIQAVRLEDVRYNIGKIDIVTSRALAPLSALCAWLLPWCENNPQLYALFPKGKTWKSEIEEAKKEFIFNVMEHKSETDSEGCILRIDSLTKRP